MDWLPILISACIVVALAAWMVVREDASTSGRGRHRILATRRTG